MKILLWVIFYLITSIFLLYFFVREKKVIGFIRKEKNEYIVMGDILFSRRSSFTFIKSMTSFSLKKKYTRNMAVTK